MSRPRLIIFWALLAVLVLGHAFDEITYREHWPFSNYPMFANVHQTEIVSFDFVGLTTGGNEITLSPSLIPALPMYKLQSTLRHCAEGSPPDPTRLRHLMTDYLSIYESRRKQHLLDGPALAGLRLYRVNYSVDAALMPVSEKSSQPARTMKFEVDRDDKVSRSKTGIAAS